MNISTLFSSLLTPASQQCCDELAAIGCFDVAYAAEAGVDPEVMATRANIIYNWGQFIPEDAVDLISEDFNAEVSEALFDMWIDWVEANHPSQDVELIDMALGCC